MKHTLTLLVFLFISALTHAQKIKTQFLVIGTNVAGIGAAVQAAKAGVKTIIIDSTTVLGTDVEKIDTTFTLGLDGQFLKQRRTGKQRQEILSQWLQEHKKLKLLTRVRVTSKVKGKDGWELKLSNGQQILANWVFEDQGPKISEYAPGKFLEDFDISITSDNWPGSQYRTQVGVPRGNNKINSYPLSRFLRTERENWIVIPAVGKSFSTGQIVGAMAANAMNNNPGDFDVRMVQKMLLTEGLYLDNYNDIQMNDPNFEVFQRIFATGLLRPGFYTPGGMLARPEEAVAIKNIVNSFIDYYKSSAVWFERHPMGTMSIAEAMELLFVSSHKSFDAQIELEWAGKLRFSSTFDPQRAITRREFAVLIDAYLKPFEVAVHMNGDLRR